MLPSTLAMRMASPEGKSTVIISPGLISLSWATLTKPVSGIGVASLSVGICWVIGGYYRPGFGDWLPGAGFAVAVGVGAVYNGLRERAGVDERARLEIA